MRTSMTLSHWQWACLCLGGLAVVVTGCAQTGHQPPRNDEQALRALAAALPAMEAAEKNLPRTHRASEIRGQVVDAETGAPIAGAAVVANWEMTVIIGLQYASERLHLVEAITDATGTYVIPAWGPKLLPLGAEVAPNSPVIRVLKSGYKPGGAANEYIGRARDSEWNGKAIKLDRPTGTLEEQAIRLMLMAEFHVGSKGDDSQDWRNYPRTTIEASREAQRLAALGFPRQRIFVRDIEKLDKTDREFLRRFE